METYCTFVAGQYALIDKVSVFFILKTIHCIKNLTVTPPVKNWLVKYAPVPSLGYWLPYVPAGNGPTTAFAAAPSTGPSIYSLPSSFTNEAPAKV